MALLMFVIPAVGMADPAVPLLWDGSDIQAFRAIDEDGIPATRQVDAYAVFVTEYPRSPLAEIALARFLNLGGQPEQMLVRLPPADRAYLTTSFRTHREHLAASPLEGPALTALDTPTPSDREAPLTDAAP